MSKVPIIPDKYSDLYGIINSPNAVPKHGIANIKHNIYINKIIIAACIPTRAITNKIDKVGIVKAVIKPTKNTSNGLFLRSFAPFLFTGLKSFI